jgi:hypothetical protein
MAKRLTFVKAKEEILKYLDTRIGGGWAVFTRNRQTGRELKIPYAINPMGTRIAFHTQAVYYGDRDGGHMTSFHADIRDFTPVQFEATYRDLKPFVHDDDARIETNYPS